MIDYECEQIVDGVTKLYTFQAANDLAASRYAMEHYALPGAYLKLRRKP